MKIIKKIENFNKIRNISKMNYHNDGTRTLFESVIYPEIILALKDWKENSIKNCVLIGGLALSHYVKPRTTIDIDMLFSKDEDIPNRVLNFKRNRIHAFEHNKTQVEVELLTPDFIKIPLNVIQSIFSTSITSDGIRIASPSGLVSSKLFRFNRQDQADIEQLIKYCDIDLLSFNLSQIEIDKFDSIKNNM